MIFQIKKIKLKILYIFFIVLSLNFKNLEFTKLYYVLLSIIIYFPAQKLFENINDKKFSKFLNLIALSYGLLILTTYV